MSIDCLLLCNRFQPFHLNLYLKFYHRDKIRLVRFTMAFLPILHLFLLLAAQAAYADNQTVATTLQPVFAPPSDGTSTIYVTTTTLQSGVDCGGSSLVVSTFSGEVATDVCQSYQSSSGVIRLGFVKVVQHRLPYQLLMSIERRLPRTLPL